jgi:hypothetical protein
MLKNIRNYSALFLVSLVILTNAAFAGSISEKARGSELINVESKSYNYFNRFLTAAAPQSYRLTVKDGEEKSVKIQSNEGVSIKLYLPNGEVKEYKEEKSFNLEFQTAGEYVVELQAASLSKYTLKVSTK